MKRYGLLVFLLSFFGHSLPLRLELIGKLKEAAVAKKIKLRVELESQEAAVYADQINFSIDGDAIFLHKPIILIQPAQEFVPLNKSIKAIYQGGFDVEIGFDKSPSDIINELRRCKVFMSSLVLFKDGTTQSKTVFVYLNQPKKRGTKQSEELIQSENDPQKEINSAQECDYRCCEIALFDQIESCWLVVSEGVNRFFGSDLFLILYSLLFGMVVLLGLLWVVPFTRTFFFNAPWKLELIQGIVLFEMGLSFKFIQFFCEFQYVFYSLAVFFLITGFFYVRSKYPTWSLLSKIRITIGLILIGLVLPLLAKGLMVSW